MASIVTNLAPFLPSWENGSVKMTVDVPDPLFRRAKTAAAQLGMSLKVFLTLALREQLRRQPAAPSPSKPWLKALGGMRELRAETKRIGRTIAREFERTDDEEWR